ncbi:hypothetical protein, partial [Gordonia soli]
YVAAWLFGAVGIGLDLPTTAIEQFDARHVWDVSPGATSAGGHYVSLVARRGFVEVVTWGRTHPVTPRFIQQYADEAIVYITPDRLTTTASPEGFAMSQLIDDLAQLN